MNEIKYISPNARQSLKNYEGFSALFETALKNAPCNITFTTEDNEKLIRENKELADKLYVITRKLKNYKSILDSGWLRYGEITHEHIRNDLANILKVLEDNK